MKWYEPTAEKLAFDKVYTRATIIASLASTTPLSDAARSGNTPSPAELAAHLYDSSIPDEGGRHRRKSCGPARTELCLRL